jgi:hypothetical protein
MPSPSEGNGLVFTKGMTKISWDDKAAVPVGEPDFPVRTNVRAKSAAIVSSALVNEPTAMDHDYHRASMRVSFALIGRVPDELFSSWRVGKVTAVLKDGATQHSTAMRHSIEVANQVDQLVEADDEMLRKAGNLRGEMTSRPFAFLFRADGGSDHNHKNASVQLALVYLFFRLKADILVAIITAAGVSHVNEVEGVMPVANLAFQHQSFERKKMSSEMEALFKPDGSAKAIRNKITSQPTEATRNEARSAWRECMESVRLGLNDRLRQASYSQMPVSVNN